MTISTGKRKTHFKCTKPTNRLVNSFGEWLPENRHFYAGFCLWLKEGEYSSSTRNIYSVTTRFALGYLNLPIEQIQPEHIEQVRVYLEARPLSTSTRVGYHKGLNKLAEYLRFSKPKVDVNWDGFLKDLPPVLADSIRRYVTHCAHSWRNTNRLQRTRSLPSQLCTFSHSTHVVCIQDITPKTRFAHVEVRLKENIQPTSLNTTLRILHSFLRYLQSEGQPICERMLEVRPLKTGQSLPRDLSVSKVKALFKAIQNNMDRAWFLLMLHSGLRTCEIRNLRISDIDLSQQSVHIRETKNQRERVVYLSPPTVEAIQNYLANQDNSNEYLFTCYHKPLSSRYCQSRLTTLGKQVNVKVTPHQLRHTCGTLLLNAGMSIFALQSLLGHRHVETTLNYARLYDDTVAKQFLGATISDSKA